MTRNKVLKDLQEIVSPSDVVLCAGKSLCAEVPLYNKGTFLFTDESLDILTLATGVAMATDKKVTVIVEDGYLLRHYSGLLQASVSDCKNLYFIVLITNNYGPTIKQPTITNSFRSLKGMFFNTGMVVHEYDAYFRTKKSLEVLADIMYNTVGPVIGTISASSQRLNKQADINITNIDPAIAFVRNRDLKTSIKKPSELPFDLDAIMKDK